VPDATPNKPIVSASPPAKPTDGKPPLAKLSTIIRKAEGRRPDRTRGGRRMAHTPRHCGHPRGNVAQEAVKALTARYAGKNTVIQESVAKKLDELRAELSGQNPTPLEKLLVERVVATWLHLRHLEAQYGGKDCFPLALGNHYQKWISAAQKRFLAAIKGPCGNAKTRTAHPAGQHCEEAGECGGWDGHHRFRGSGSELRTHW
jgi:hypothetical protein